MSLTFGEGVWLFVVVLTGSFIVLYPLRVLGVHMGPFGGREDSERKNSRVK
jgi:hypothetical protein